LLLDLFDLQEQLILVALVSTSGFELGLQQRVGSLVVLRNLLDRNLLILQAKGILASVMASDGGCNRPPRTWLMTE